MVFFWGQFKATKARQESLPAREVGGGCCWSCAWRTLTEPPPEACCGHALAAEAPGMGSWEQGRSRHAIAHVCFLFSILYYDCGSTILLLGRKDVAGLGSPPTTFPGAVRGLPCPSPPMCDCLHAPFSVLLSPESKEVHLVCNSYGLRVQASPTQWDPRAMLVLER